MTAFEKIEAARPGAAPSEEYGEEFQQNDNPSSTSSIEDFDKTDNTATSQFQGARQRSKEVHEEYEESQSVLPLQREIAPATAFPFDALGALLGPLAKRIHEIVRAPDSVCGQSVLAVASLLTQAHADVHIDGRIHPLSLFVLTVAQSGDRKSAVDNIVLKPVREHEKKLAETLAQEKRSFRIKLDIWRRKRERLLREGESDEEDLVRQLNDLGEEPKPPLEPHLIIEEPTFPGLLQLYTIGQPNIGLFSDEGGRMFGGHGMKEENLLNTICGLSSLWDGKPISRIRRSDENLLLHGRRLASHLMIQETVLGGILKNEQLIGQGMIARCLIAFPPSNAGERPYNAIDVSNDDIILKFNKQASEILNAPLLLKNPNISTELSPRPLLLNADAKAAWVRFHNETDSLLKPDEKYRPISRTASKSAEQALRIAGVLTLIDNFQAITISLEVMERAIILAKFYLDEMLRIIELGFTDPALDLAESLLKWMKKKAAESGNNKVFSLRDIYKNGGPRGIRTKDAAVKILKLLKSHGMVVNIGENKWKLDVK
jgi:hypothetical protein